MLPIKDVNPTRRRAFVTLAIVAACIGIWLGWQEEPQRSDVDDLVFNLEHAAIPCELTQREPLSPPEIEATFGRLGGDAESCGIESDADSPVFADKSVWLAVLASMFFHGSLLHIGGNLLFLWIFGNNIEDHLGHVRYLIFYILGGIAATATHVALEPNSTIPIVGASGAIAAVMGAYLVWFPRAPVRTVIMLGFPILATIKARWVLGVWFVLQFLTSPNSAVAWAAHVGGFVFGAAVGLLVRYVPPVRAVMWTRDYARATTRRPTGPWDATGGVGDVHEYHRYGPHRR